MFLGLLAVINSLLCWVSSGLFLGMAQLPLEKSLSPEDQEAKRMGWSAIKGAVVYTENFLHGYKCRGTAVATVYVGRRNAIGFCWTGAHDIVFSFIRRAILDSCEGLVSHASHSLDRGPISPP